ncbi:MAG TPA: hypothetical protein VML94_08240 [Thermoplasmata archaeon]|nr:hypothetical protein [Thermoplasmata archaeon]
MIAVPSNLPVGVYPLILVGDILVFVLIGLAFRLLRPRPVSGVIWVSPLFHLYTLGAVLLALFEALRSQPGLALIPEFGSFLVAAGVGAAIGSGVGRRIPVTRDAQGKVLFTGGRLLVGLVVGLLAPLALEQAVVLFGALASVRSLLHALTGAFPFNYLLLGLGFLFVLGTFLSLAWRVQVWAKRGQG